MSAIIHKLYIDESGSPELSHHDKNYTLCGVIVRPYQADSLKTKADQIKFKYWNDTDIVFHSVEIGLMQNDFTILKNPDIKKNFHKDLIHFLNDGMYKVIVVSVDKEKATKQGLDSKNIQDMAFDKMIGSFLAFLTKNKQKGQIHMETSGGRDVNLHRRFIFHSSHGYPDLSLTHSDVKTILTSVSFVSKNNHDIETQLADIFAYPATRYFLHIEEKKPLVVGSYEEKVTNILKQKLIDVGGEKSLIRIPSQKDEKRE
jgi:hypothetical protein